MKQIALAAVVLCAIAAPAFANHHEGDKAKGKMCEAGKVSTMSNGAMAMVDSEGCTITCSKDGNNIMMMKDGMMMVGDKKAGTWTVIKGGKPMPIAKGSKEAKMGEHHMMMMMKK